MSNPNAMDVKVEVKPLAETKQSEAKLAAKKDARDSDLVVNVDKDLVCCICLQLMDNPHSYPCGHSFCKGISLLSPVFRTIQSSLYFLCFPLTGCLEQLKDFTCPVDRQVASRDSIHPNSFLALKISGILVVTIFVWCIP
jgi:hypothetical protein